MKEGNRWVYTSPVTCEVLKDYKKNFRKNGWLDIIMSEKEHWDRVKVAAEGFDDTTNDIEEDSED